MSEDELFAQLSSAERWTRYQARRLLFHRPTGKVASAADAFIAQDRPERQRLEALGVMQSHGLVRPALLDRLCASSDFRIRAYAARVAGEWSSALPDAQARLNKAAVDPHPRVRLEAVVALSHVGGRDSLRSALGAADHPRDKFLDYGLRQTVRHLLPSAGGLADQLPPAQAVYLRKIAGSGPPAVPVGQEIYEALCLNCHQAAGQGLEGVYPPLAGSEWVRGDKDRLIRIVLHGLEGPTKVAGKTYGVVPMPPMGLDDQQAAEVLNYVRGTWGGKGLPAVSADDVARIRAASRPRPWTQVELDRAR